MISPLGNLLRRLIGRMPEPASKHPLVWIDGEMTGLDPETDSILSLACFITDHDLNLLEPDGLQLTIHHDRHRLERMGDWCRTHHARSGLTDAALASGTTAEQAAAQLLAYVRRHAPEPRRALLAGNSVHADKAFLKKAPYGPVVEHLHHRILDVSALKEAARRWAPAEVLRRIPPKRSLHEARQDILESIEEARFYRDVFFRRAVVPHDDDDAGAKADAGAGAGTGTGEGQGTEADADADATAGTKEKS